jgi:hypothetical protein
MERSPLKRLKNYPNAYMTGIDYWGGQWNYSKEACEKNAQLAGVSERTIFPES